MSTNLLLGRRSRSNAICLRADWDSILVYPDNYLKGNRLKTSIWGYSRISAFHTISIDHCTYSGTQQ